MDVVERKGGWFYISVAGRLGQRENKSKPTTAICVMGVSGACVDSEATSWTWDETRKDVVRGERVRQEEEEEKKRQSPRSPWPTPTVINGTVCSCKKTCLSAGATRLVISAQRQLAGGGEARRDGAMGKAGAMGKGKGRKEPWAPSATAEPRICGAAYCECCCFESHHRAPTTERE